jgi:hypothetical protein
MRQSYYCKRLRLEWKLHWSHTLFSTNRGGCVWKFDSYKTTWARIRGAFIWNYSRKMRRRKTNRSPARGPSLWDMEFNLLLELRSTKPWNANLPKVVGSTKIDNARTLCFQPQKRWSYRFHADSTANKRKTQHIWDSPGHSLPFCQKTIRKKKICRLSRAIIHEIVEECYVKCIKKSQSPKDYISIPYL